MSKRLTEYVLNIWSLWSAKASWQQWFYTWRRIVQDCCCYTRQGWSDAEILRVIRYTREDTAFAAANNDPYNDFYTE